MLILNDMYLLKKTNKNNDLLIFLYQHLIVCVLGKNVPKSFFFIVFYDFLFLF